MGWRRLAKERLTICTQLSDMASHGGLLFDGQRPISIDPISLQLHQIDSGS